jgi:hypothetical protein
VEGFKQLSGGYKLSTKSQIPAIKLPSCETSLGNVIPFPNQSQKKNKPIRPGSISQIPKKNGNPPDYTPAAKSLSNVKTIPVVFSFTYPKTTNGKISVTASFLRVRELQISVQGTGQKPRFQMQNTKPETSKPNTQYPKHDTEHRTPITIFPEQATRSTKPKTQDPITGTKNPKLETHIGYIPSAQKKIIHQKVIGAEALPE